MKFLTGFFIIVAVSTQLSCSTAEKNGTPKLSKTEEARLQVQAATGFLQDKKFALALQSLNDAEKLDDSLPEIYHVRALVDFYREQLPEAIEEEKRALKVNPNYTEANNTLGKFLVDQNKPDEAIPYLEKATSDQVYRELYKPLTNLGIAYYRKALYAKSGEYFNRAIVESPELACVAFYYRGHLDLLNGQVQLAIDDYAQASKHFCTSFVEAHFAQATAYVRAKRTEQAKKKFLEIHDRFPDSPLASKALDEVRKLP